MRNISVLIISFLILENAAEEACQYYSHEHVFPQETRRTSGHTTQWSQAVSKLIFFLDF